MKTTALRSQDIEQKWYLIDCSEKTLGRLSVRVANILLNIPSQDESQTLTHIGMTGMHPDEERIACRIYCVRQCFAFHFPPLLEFFHFF